jgi:hypothetical protein
VINPQVCRACRLLCGVEEGRYDKSGDVVSFPVVVCSPAGPSAGGVPSDPWAKTFFLEDDPPEWCDYVAEHVVSLGGVKAEEDGFWGPKSYDAGEG